MSIDELNDSTETLLLLVSLYNFSLGGNEKKIFSAILLKLSFLSYLNLSIYLEGCKGKSGGYGWQMLSDQT